MAIRYLSRTAARDDDASVATRISAARIPSSGVFKPRSDSIMGKRLLGEVLVLVTVLAALALSGCVIAPVVPPLGLVYSSVSAPLDLTSRQDKEIGPAKGEASTTTVFYLFSVGDAGINAAARNGKLKTVNHVDYAFKNVLFGFFSRYTTVAYGEAK
jgi:hypothetical protein